MKKVLSTKTLDAPTLAHARSLGLNIDCVDFIETKAVDFKLELVKNKNYDALIFTSANAVKYFFKNTGADPWCQTLGKPTARQVPGTLSIFSTGYKTAEALRKAAPHLEPALSAIDASQLADKIIQSNSAKSVLHICGDKTLNILKVKLEGKGIEYTALVVYNAVLLNPKLPHQNFDAIMFFSPSGIESFYANNKPGAETLCCCIGGTTAQALRKADAKANIIISKQPHAEAMIDIMSKYFQQSEIIK